jgi:hypothetical protein
MPAGVGWWIAALIILVVVFAVVSRFNSGGGGSAGSASEQSQVSGNCSDDNLALVAKGLLLGAKALNEHHLSSGDSRTDINQAITLLAQCQSTPGLYGTQVGAGCETEEETLINYKINWEMNE